MKNILKNYNYLSMIIGALFSLISLITILFIKSNVYFTVVFIVQILVNFAVTSVLLLGNLKQSQKFIWILGYLIATFALLSLDVVLIANLWNMNIYSNLMYLTNVQLYILLYGVFVLCMAILSGYAYIKNYQKSEDKTSIRQNAAKQ